MNKNLLYLFLIVFASCSEGEKKSPNVFFAGEIVNPTNDYVVLYKGDELIDSAKLDKNSRFSFNLDSISDGLYNFNHAPEYQYLYLTKGDSLMVRLNTVAFDESLVFTGIGEEINNFLLDLFLVHEKEDPEIYDSYYGMEPKEFKERIGILKKEKLTDLNTLQSEANLSKEAYEIAKANIDYTYYCYMERYPFKHRKRMQESKIHELPKDFYDYRIAVNYNNQNLNYLRPYYDFMKAHFGNMSYMNCSHKCGSEKEEIVKNQLHFNRHKLKLIDSIVKDKELKDNLFRNVAVHYLLNSHDKEKNNKIFIEEFHKLSENNKHINEIDELYQSIKNIQPNKAVPNLYVSNVNGDTVSLQEIAKDNKTVFYFWTGTDTKHYNNIAKRVLKLSKEKPGYKFVGINIKTEESNWKALIENKGLDEAFQYRAKDYKKLTKTLIVDRLNKCIIAEDAKIVNAFSDMYASF